MAAGFQHIKQKGESCEMLPAERYEKVKAHLQQHRYANINELAEMFHTSTPTIRRCLKQLGYQKIRLGVDKGNPQSFAFWSKNGFQVTGETEYIHMERVL